MPRVDLVADCGRCAALCCVWSAFDASDDFAFSKRAGVACHHLDGGGRCAIHAELAVRGHGGCVAYDCHGAGPRATRLFAASLLSRRQRHELFLAVGELHELLWVLDGAASLCPAEHDALRADLAAAIAALDAVAASSARTLLAAPLAPHRAAADALLRRLRAALGQRRRGPMRAITSGGT